MNAKLLHAQALLAQISRDLRKSERENREILRKDISKLILAIEDIFLRLEKGK